MNAFPALAKNSSLPDVKMHKLSNGLTLMVVVRKESPVVSCYRYHKVGSINETMGKTGIAHFLEHLHFKGTTTMGTVDYKKEVPIMKEIDVTVEDIQRVAKKYMHPDKLTIIVVGNPEKFDQPLNVLGKVKEIEIEK